MTGIIAQVQAQTEVSGTSVWVIIGVLVGCGIVFTVILAFGAWLLKLIALRFIKSVDDNARATAALTSAMNEHRTVVAAEVKSVRDNIENNAKVNEAQFMRIHDRMNSGSEVHSELRNRVSVIERRTTQNKRAIARLEFTVGIDPDNRTTDVIPRGKYEDGNESPQDHDDD